ncbi:MAG TPA: Uma2 family endonuclease [Micromonosporaceae bacterium]|nr:Uma2 family endonuclease [Micromonosporaceae bacterium]
MTEAFAHVLPWTEEEYLALGETPDRVELFDGSLLVSPAATPRHQIISRRLTNAFLPAAEAAGLGVYEVVNVRLRPGRVPIPDLVIVEPIDEEVAVIDADSVRLICEIVSPGNPATDRVLKMHYYAEAGIGWYLLVEQKPTVTLRLYRLDGDKYTEAQVGEPGRPIRFSEPVRLDLDPVVLERDH